jgi:hypothetical protein
MKLAPDVKTRSAIKFWLDCLQVVTVIGGVITVVVTFKNYKDEQTARAIAQEQHAIETRATTKRELETREQHATETLATAKRELERPYEEKKLALYLDAARVLAHLAATPDVDKEQTEARFWELYWGELAFVESQFKDEQTGSSPSVERLMVQFCHVYFSPGKCTTIDGPGGSQMQSRTAIEAAAIEMAHQASKEIRLRAENIGK